MSDTSSPSGGGSTRTARVVPHGIVWPFILLSSLFLAWAIPNNMTDTMLAAFKRIMSLSDSRTAWIQIACYFCGYGCFALPGAIFIKKHTYKSGVLLGLGMFAGGAMLITPAGWAAGVSMTLCFMLFLVSLVILFAGLSILETSTNSYVCAIGAEETATQRLNFAQSFNPFGAIIGVVVSQVFVLSNLNVLTAEQRAELPKGELFAIQQSELHAVTNAYLVLGLIMAALFTAIYLTRMPILKEDDKSLNLKDTFRRLFKNGNYVWGVIAQFFYVGAQIAVWSFIIRYVQAQMNLDEVVKQLGADATPEMIIEKLRGLEPVAAGFYNVCEWVGLDALLPRTSEQAGATYYIMSLILFVIGRFTCTLFMDFFKPRNLLTALSALATVCCLTAIYSTGHLGLYALMGISFCMSLMFPTIYGLGIAGLGEDTKVGGSGMVMAIAGAAVLTQIQGQVSTGSGSIKVAYWVPAIAFLVVGFYGAVICRKHELSGDVPVQI